MQPFTADPRSGMSDDQVRSILTDPGPVQRTCGLDLCDTSGSVIEDISVALVRSGSEVERNNFADVHGIATLVLKRSLSWGAVLLRPRMTVAKPSGSLTAYLGLFQPDAPKWTVGLSTYTVQAKDLLSWLQSEIGDTWSAEPGALVVDEMQRVAEAGGLPAALIRVDRTSSATIPDAGRVWPLQQGSPTFLGVLNDLAAMCGYRGAWMDWTGVLRVDPYTAPRDRQSELLFTAGMVDRNPVVTSNLWGRPDWWRFIRNGLTVPPSEGAGFVTRSDPAGQEMLGGRLVRKVTWVDAADDAALAAFADQSVDADQAVTQTVDCTTGPIPLAWHDDVYTWSDPAALGTVKVAGQSWTLPFDDQRMTHTWKVVG